MKERTIEELQAEIRVSNVRLAACRYGSVERANEFNRNANLQMELGRKELAKAMGRKEVA